MHVVAEADAAGAVVFLHGRQAGGGQLRLQRRDAAVAGDATAHLGVLELRVQAVKALAPVVVGDRDGVGRVVGVAGQAAVRQVFVHQDVDHQLQRGGVGGQGLAAGVLAAGQLAVALGQGGQGVGLGPMAGAHGLARGQGGGAGEVGGVAGLGLGVGLDVGPWIEAVVALVDREVEGREHGGRVVEGRLRSVRGGLDVEVAGPALSDGAGAQGGDGDVVEAGGVLGGHAGQIVAADLGPDLFGAAFVCAFFHAAIICRAATQAR